MAGGDGNVYLGYAFNDSDIKSNVCAFCTVTLEKGGSVGMHQHTEDDEIYYILSGNGLVDGQYLPFSRPSTPANLSMN